MGSGGALLFRRLSFSFSEKNPCFLRRKTQKEYFSLMNENEYNALMKVLEEKNILHDDSHRTRQRIMPDRRKNAARKNQKESRKISIFAAIAVVILLFAVFISVMLSRGDALKGTWDLDGITAYQFDGKGKGSLNLPDSSYPFSYEITGSDVSIDFESDEARDMTYSFFAEKDKLTLTYKEGKETIVFELVKQK